MSVPQGYGVLDVSYRVSEAGGWPGGPTSARIDVYVMDASEFAAYATETKTFVARFTYLNLAAHRVNGLQFHNNRSRFESDGVAAKVVVFDNTDRDSFGVVPPADSLVSIEFAVLWRGTNDPSRLVSNCVNRAQVHENQFVYYSFSGPGLYDVRLVPQEKCLFEESKPLGCQYQSVTLDARNFALYVASLQFYTLDPAWDIGNSAGLPGIVTGIDLRTANDTAYVVVRKFDSAQGSQFEDNALVVSLAIERQGGTPCAAATFAAAPPPPPAAVAAAPVPSGCSALLIVADAFCSASQCSTSCDRALCAVNGNSSCTLPSTRSDAFQSACGRLLSCLAPPTTTAPGTPMPITEPVQRFACVQADLDRCATFRLRCFQIALKEQPNNASAACSCQGSYASCIPDNSFPPCDRMKSDARASCLGDTACSMADCNAPAPFVVAGVTMMTSSTTAPAPGATTTAPSLMLGSTTRVPTTAATSPTTATPSLNSSPSLTTTSPSASTGTVCDVPRQCVEKCGATNIKSCSCELQECQATPSNETIVVTTAASTLGGASTLVLLLLLALL